MVKRGQAAMEFLMTYGWAILAVILSITALAYFGVLNPARFLPESCTLFPGLACKDFTITDDGDMITIMLANGFGSPLTLTQDTKLNNCGGCFVKLNNLDLPQPVSDGQTVNLSFYLTSGSIADAGSKFKSDISVGYQLGSVGLTHTRVGSLVVRIPATAGSVPPPPPPPTCALNTASWDITSANQGQPVGMTIVTSNCIGSTMNFEVWEDDTSDPDDAATVNPSPVSITTNTVATWTAEWQDDSADLTGNPPEWYFKAYIASDPSNSITSAANLNTNPIVSTLTFYPSEDARVQEANPTTNYGSATFLQVAGAAGARKGSGLKFNVVGITGPVISATLNIKTYTAAADACAATSPYKCVRIYSVPDNSWTELGITWNNQPALGIMLSSLEDLPVATFNSLDVTSAITGDGTYSFALDQTPDIPNDYAGFYSREASGTTNDPYLLITY